MDLVFASPWQAGCGESFCGRFKQELGNVHRVALVGEMIEAIYQHTRYSNHDRIHTALKMPLVVFTVQLPSGTCHQKLVT